MKQILITKTGVIYGYNGVNTLDEVYSGLAQGALVAFTEDGTYLDGATTELFKNFYFVLGTQEGPITTPIINYKTFSYSKDAYVAPVMPIRVIGTEAGGNGALNFPASLTTYIGKSASIMLVDKRYPPNDKRREKYYTVPITAVSTNASILTAIVAAITADTKKICSAALAGGSAGIVLTGLYGDFDWVNMGGVFENTTQATAGGSFAAYVIGHGTYAQVLQIEKDFSPLRGNTSNTLLRDALFSVTWQAVTAITYNIYTLRWHAEQEAIYGTEVPKWQELLIAVPTTEYDATETGTVLDALLPVINVAADAIA